ncbi:MAG TPA: GxxExxY protein [Gemmatimonadales bacterium]|nr:GxxExxY protein [Gemmatimonadales bacterium]
MTSTILGAAIEVHKALGAGYLESVYANALDVALRERRVQFSREHEIELCFHGQKVGEHRLDLLVEGLVVVELKAVESLAPVHFAQVRSYLLSTGLPVGLLLNFNAPVLEVKRVVNTPTERHSGVFRVPALP